MTFFNCRYVIVISDMVVTRDLVSIRRQLSIDLAFDNSDCKYISCAAKYALLGCRHKSIAQ
ncbi:hypothetical protein JCM18900_11906 [Psychrobacter sp. JCM 18900]|nr:hypothetical protein JCM18900_11906 [Psychrobacter sp. JCM 18900]